MFQILGAEEEEAAVNMLVVELTFALQVHHGLRTPVDVQLTGKTTTTLFWFEFVMQETKAEDEQP